MRFAKLSQWSFLAGLGLVLTSGCERAPVAEKPVPAASGSAKSAERHEHDHPSTGPHQGQLIELGKEDYHAELVHDDKTGTVTVYLLDNHAQGAVAVDAPEVTINVKHEGNAEQFKLVAAPLETDAKPKASRFTSTDKELAKDLDSTGVEARLVVEIDGKSYTGEVHHEHHADGEKSHEHKHQ